MYEREIVADYDDHHEGQRELVNWDRHDANGAVVTHRNVPVVYLRRASKAEYLERNPGAPSGDLDGYSFWEVSID